MFQSQVTVLVGHFGSGKTEIALNGALDLADHGEKITLVDLDIVKPYFRSRAARSLLKEHRIQLIAPEGELIYSDLPIIVPQVRDAIRRPQMKTILDVGGDGSGAKVLGSFSDIIPKAETSVLIVLNFSRPSTPDPDRAIAMVQEIEAVSRLRATGLISNTHMMDETTPEIVLEGAEMAIETGKHLGIPVVAAAVNAETESGLNGRLPCPAFHLRRIVRPPFEMEIRRRTVGPLFLVN